MRIEMVPKKEVKKLKTRNFIMKLESTCRYHIGGYGKLIKIKNEPICVFDLDVMIEQLQNARILINPNYKDADYSQIKHRVFIWKHQPALVLIEGVKKQMVYGIAPIIYDENKKFIDWKGGMKMKEEKKSKKQIVTGDKMQDMSKVTKDSEKEIVND